MVTASGRNLPPRTCGNDVGVTSNMVGKQIGNRRSRAMIRHVDEIDAGHELNNSPATCCGPPTPAEAMLILPGLALA